MRDKNKEQIARIVFKAFNLKLKGMESYEFGLQKKELDLSNEKKTFINRIE